MRQFYKTLNKLRKKVPATHPVYVYIVDSKNMKDIYGDSYFTGKRYVIRIAKGNWDVMKLILIHEWSHCIVRKNLSHKECHGEEWGKAYSLCWKAYVGE